MQFTVYGNTGKSAVAEACEAHSQRTKAHPPPPDISDSAKAADSIRRLLSNLVTITNGVAELRNSYGTGHGKSAKTKGLGSRHARLAIGAASTLAVFLFETHKDR